jgi:acyl carrier protein
MSNQQVVPVKKNHQVMPASKQPVKGGHADTFNIVQSIIADTTGNEIDDITLDADLEEDLGINMINEFPAIVTKIKLDIPDVKLPITSVLECTTVGELVDLIDEEREL